MTNETFVKNLGKEYLDLLEQTKNSKFKVNEAQFTKFHELLNFFRNYISKFGGKLKIDFDPREIDAGLTAEFSILDLTRDDITHFCNTLRYASAISFDATNNYHIEISLTVPNVFEFINK